MSLSRTARILIALLLVAAAAFLWVNYFNPSTTEPTPLITQPTTVPGAAASDAASNSPTSSPVALAGGQEAQGTATVTGATAEGDLPPGVATDGSVTEQAQQNGVAVVPAVVAPPTVVLRDLVVDELPFLVTSPPLPQEGDEEADGGGATRPGGVVRSNINPFSPVVVQAPPAQAAPMAFADVPPASQPDVVIVESSGQPPAGTPAGTGQAPAGASTVAQPIVPPAPRALAPAPGRVSELPRPLPSGTLPITPDILRDVRAEPAQPAAPEALPEMAAVIVPDEVAAAELPAVGEQTDVASTTVDVLGPGQPTEEASQPEVAATRPAAPNIPVFVGADALSRYLRDNDVRFTGTALGPLSVGVFRAKQFDQPVVLTLGQSLPDTDIVLADLRGYEAKFSLGENTQVLSLDLRR